MDFSIMFGGEAGQGIATAGILLARAFARGGYHVFGLQDYESRIRGGHNFFQLRLRDKPTYAHAEPVNLLIAMNQETVDLHRGEMATGGLIILDEELAPESNDVFFSMPLETLAREKGGNPLTINSVAAGADCRRWAKDRT